MKRRMSLTLKRVDVLASSLLKGNIQLPPPDALDPKVGEAVDNSDKFSILDDISGPWWDKGKNTRRRMCTCAGGCYEDSA